MLYVKRKKIQENLEKLKKSNPNPPVVSQHLLSWQEEMAVEREIGREEDTSGGGGGARTMCSVERRTQVRGGGARGKGGHKWGGEQVSTPKCTD